MSELLGHVWDILPVVLALTVPVILAGLGRSTCCAGAAGGAGVGLGLR